MASVQRFGSEQVKKIEGCVYMGVRNAAAGATGAKEKREFKSPGAELSKPGEV